MEAKLVVIDVARMRAATRARTHVLRIATDDQPTHSTRVLRKLNEALATEIACVLRYRRHHLIACNLGIASVARDCLAHADEEQQHAELIARRIVQLGGQPEFSPHNLERLERPAGVLRESLVEMMQEDLLAERIAIDGYRSLIDELEDRDPTTRSMLHGILSMELDHAHDLSGALHEV